MNCAANKSRKGCAQGHQPCPTPWSCGGYQSEAHFTAMTSPVLCLNEHDSAAALTKDKRWPTAAKVMCIVGAVAVPAAGYLALKLWPILSAIWRLS